MLRATAEPWVEAARVRAASEAVRAVLDAAVRAVPARAPATHRERRVAEPAMQPPEARAKAKREPRAQAEMVRAVKGLSRTPAARAVAAGSVTLALVVPPPSARRVPRRRARQRVERAPARAPRERGGRARRAVAKRSGLRALA